jgi:predicted DNA-binding transcriptional regulator YafY
MNRTERFYKIDRLLSQHRHVPVSRFLQELEISPATFKRDIEFMRSRLHAPIVWDREHSGYCFTTPPKDAPRYELPGLWFNASEIHALLAMEQLLEGIDPGILSQRLDPLKARLRELLGSADHSAEEVRRRIKVVPMARRALPAGEFEIAASALLNRKRLFMRYAGRTVRDAIAMPAALPARDDTEREVSPQRLVHYRENWYLDAWCHMRKALRTFAVDRIRDAEVRATPAIDVDEAELDAVLGSGYGIFAGREVTWAKLRFSPVAARWVASESWHPKQRASFEADGSYILEIPFSDDRELLRDILRHGADVDVLTPQSLREKVKAALVDTLKRYE